ncbi:MAG: IS91 family transposase [Ardenticatenaceae bacterium]|nr:IS91 family transposase [Ardenticatenaceae bacterium]MCB9422129.1 IS91 family transposase [Ardenticatenaceae bacterium]MCB9443648.1 IS91 family transposase [Ardenticatenaceae bacterium]MCB9445550.1 IS91 family transposase [Ardenticatenaceae bacterium]
MLKTSSPLKINVETEKPAYELADVFRLFGDEYRQQYHVSHQQRLVMRDVVQCRTAALGGHVDECDACGGLRISYNSCRNRHCPKCGASAKMEWLEKQKAHLLPIHYFHVVFTIDHLFNPLARVNQKQIYNLLFASASQTLKAFGQRYLGGEIGFTAILHTWGQTLTEHLHLHCIVPGGALSSDGKRWRATAPDFLFPITELSVQFRDAFCAGVKKLFDDQQLTFAGQCADLADAAVFEGMIAESQAKKWQVYAKPPFSDAAQTLDYLGRYVNRIAISNGRILGIEDGAVRFSYRDYKADGERKEMRLPGVEFIRRFLQHALPKRFVRVRHYGLLAPRYRKQKLARCRALLGAYHETTTAPATTEALLTEMLGHDPAQCPLCGVGKMQLYEELQAHPTRRKWQLVVQ